jgi:hypothetical protein
MYIPKKDALTLYKVLTADKKSPYQEFTYRPRKWYDCPNFNADESIDCAAGLYATDVDGLPYAFRTNRIVYECLVWGKAVEFNQFKRRYEHMMLTRLVPHEEVQDLARRWNNRVGYLLDEALFSINPLLVAAPTIGEKELGLLKEWARVWASVWASVGDGVWDSVRGSVGASVGAYTGSLFPNISEWKYVSHKKGEYPFRAGSDLWRMGLVPSYDGKLWRLHAGKDAAIAWEGTMKEEGHE